MLSRQELYEMTIMKQAEIVSQAEREKVKKERRIAEIVDNTVFVLFEMAKMAAGKGEFSVNVCFYFEYEIDEVKRRVGVYFSQFNPAWTMNSHGQNCIYLNWNMNK